MDKEESLKASMISIIVPVFNIGDYITDCLESIRNQTYRNIEIIVVDDGSDDNTPNIVEQFANKDSRIRFIRQEHKGVVSARVNGISHARGEYIGFVDGDDVIRADMYEILASKMGETDMVSCGVLRQWSEVKTEVITNKYDEGIYAGDNFQNVLDSMIYDFDSDTLYRMTPWMVNKLYRRELVEEIDFSAADGIGYSEDAVFTFLYIKECKSITLINDSLYIYKYRDTSAIHKENPYRIKDLGSVYAILFERFKESDKSDSLIRQLKKMVISMLGSSFEKGMGFEREMTPIQFSTDFSQCRGKKIVLYGAGKCGQDFMRQLQYYQYEVCLWCDTNAKKHYANDDGIHSLEELQEFINREEDFVVLVAVFREAKAKEIVQTLKEIGINSQRIIWQKPLKVF